MTGSILSTTNYNSPSPFHSYIPIINPSDLIGIFFNSSSGGWLTSLGKYF